MYAGGTTRMTDEHDKATRGRCSAEATILMVSHLSSQGMHHAPALWRVLSTKCWYQRKASGPIHICY